MFYSALKTPKDGENSRAGFVMPNSASDARQTEQTIREKIIKDNVDLINDNIKLQNEIAKLKQYYETQIINQMS